MGGTGIGMQKKPIVLKNKKVKEVVNLHIYTDNMLYKSYKTENSSMAYTLNILNMLSRCVRYKFIK